MQDVNGKEEDTPLPVKLTARTPFPSSTLSTHSSVCRPSPFGVNRTFSMRLDPAAIVVPSGKVVSAVNSPLIGGFDLLKMRLLPPTSVNLKVSVADRPTATFPKLTDSGVIFSTDECVDLPVSVTTWSPPLLSTSRVAVYSPTFVGEKVTLTNTSALGAMVSPATGAPDVENGAPGSWTLEIFSDDEPSLKKPTP